MSEPAATEPAATAPSAPSEPAQAPAAAEAATEPAAAAPELSNSALAERFCSMGSALLRAQASDVNVWRYSEALLQAATRLDPTEPRFQSSLVETAFHAGDSEVGIKALNAYRNLRPKDESAQVQVIDFYLGRMEQLDAKLKYLDQIIAASSVPATVRSAAALRAGRLHAERMEDVAAGDMVDKALELNPLNLEALRVKYEGNPPAAPADRLRMLLQMLRSNPAQPAIGIAVARELGQVGLSKRSLDWFGLALDLHQRMGIAPANDVGVDYAAEFFVNGNAGSAVALCDRLLQVNPDDLNAWLMKLIAVKASGDKDALVKTMKQATVAATNRLAMLRQAAGDRSATTRPVDTTENVSLPDPAAEVQRLAAARNPQILAQFLPLAQGIAWLKVYFEATPAAAGQASNWIKAVAPLTGADDETTARLDGWAKLVAGNRDGARERLAPIVDKDPLAALGIIYLADDNPQARQQADALAKKTLAQYPSGLAGALLTAECVKRNITPTPTPDAPAVEKALGEFPKDWMRIIDQPQQFYTLRLDPVRVAINVGEPVLVQATLINTSDYDLTIGPEGVIHPDLWLDAQIQGLARQAFPAEAYQRLAGPLVLTRRASTVQVVRLDQRGLLAALEANPVVAFPISATVITNPTTIGGQFMIGPCGNKAVLSTMMERAGTPMNNAFQQKLMAAIQNGTPEEKIRAVETLAKFVRLWAQQAQNNPQLQQMIGWGGDMIHALATDPDPTVQAWSSYLLTVLTNDKKSWNDMLHDPIWVKRVLGIVATDYLEVDRAAIKPLAENDPDETVKKLAGAALLVKFQRPTTEPSATQPATTQPGAAPAPSAELLPTTASSLAAPPPIAPPAEVVPSPSTPPAVVPPAEVVPGPSTPPAVVPPAEVPTTGPASLPPPPGFGAPIAIPPPPPAPAAK